jgi:hypothetical protein
MLIGVEELERPGDLDRFRENVLTELQAQNAMQDLNLPQNQLESLADAIAANADYAFEIKWSPRWVKGSEPHRWAEDDDASPSGKWFFSECLSCGRLTKSSSEQESLDDYAQHRATTHGGSDA